MGAAPVGMRSKYSSDLDKPLHGKISIRCSACANFTVRTAFEGYAGSYGREVPSVEATRPQASGVEGFLGRIEGSTPAVLSSSSLANGSNRHGDRMRNSIQHTRASPPPDHFAAFIRPARIAALIELQVLFQYSLQT